MVVKRCVFVAGVIAEIERGINREMDLDLADWHAL